jgi:hypothetical protein
MPSDLPSNPSPNRNPNRNNQSQSQSQSLTIPSQVQTPQQRRANEAYAKSEAAKRGKPQTEVERIMEKKKAAKAGAQKSPVSKVWLCKLNAYLSCLSSVGIGIGGHAQALGVSWWEIKETMANEMV